MYTAPFYALLGTTLLFVFGVFYSQLKTIGQLRKRVRSLEHQVTSLTPMAHMGLFVGAIAHDIRNPLAAISLMTGLVEERVRRGLPVVPDEAYFKASKTAIKRIDQIVQHYLSLATGEDSIASSPVVLRQIVTDAIGLNAKHINNAGNPDVDVDIPSDLVVRGNPLLLELLFANLISNAAGAVSGLKDGRIQIRAKVLDGNCQIEVLDNGSGIPANHRSKLFKNVWTGRADGTGLGLRIADQIVQRHGGCIRFIEEAPQTTFEVQLPRHSA